MLVSEMLKVLQEVDDVPLHIMLPSGEFVPAHFHVTEIGQSTKHFIDCGGTKRSTFSIVLQMWTASDVDHRLTSGKLLKILSLAKDLISQDWPVEMEYGEDVVSVYSLVNVETTPAGLLFVFGGKKTACLAPDKCGVSGCC
jgi:hypothetical protein